MTRILQIARSAFQEAVRSRLFLNLLVIYALLLLGAAVVEAGSIDADGRIYHDIAHAAFSISGSMVALFVGIHLLATDIERKTLHLVLARPVTRFELITGKYLGLVGVLALNTAIVAVLYSLVALGSPSAAFRAARLLAMLFLFGQFLIVGAIAIAFSALSGTTTAAIYSLLLFVVGRLGAAMNRLAEQHPSPLYRNLSAVFRHLLPDLTRFDLDPQVALPSAGVLALSLVYALVWAAALLLLGSFAFGRRDLK